MFRYLSLIVKNSLRNRRRSALTIASIAISLCLLGVLMAIYRALFLAGPATPTQALRVVTHHKVSITNVLPASYEQKIRQTPGVRAVTVWQWFNGKYKDERDRRNFFARFSVEPDQFLTIRPEMELPDDQKLAFERERTACIAGDVLAAKFGWKLGDRITLVGDIYPVTLEFKLAGIYHYPAENETFFFNHRYLKESLHAIGHRLEDTVGSYSVLANSGDDVGRISTAIDAEFANSTAPTKTESEQAFALSFASFLGNLKMFVLAICSAVTFTILLVSANTISMSVRERIREVGIMKTLGFTPGSILGIILGESAVISLIGGALGCLMAQGLCGMVRQGPAYIGALKTLSMTPGVALLAVVVAMLIGILSSVVPAWNASKTSILDALRYAG